MMNYMYMINYFIVPLVAVYMNTYYLIGAEQELTKKSFIEYGVFVAANIPLTKIFIKLINLVTNKAINPDYASYTLIAIISAIVLSLVFNVFKKIVSIEVEVEKR